MIVQELIAVMTVLHSFNLVEGKKGPDPCERENHVVWQDPEGKLSAGTPAEPPYICHRPLDANWYRIDSPAGNDLPTTCVEKGFCGTEYPMWLDGTLPKEGEEKDITVKLTYGSCPAEVEVPDAPQTIRVKNCGEFRVYFLTQASECVNAYCFGTGHECPAGQGSETGWSPCEVAFPDIKGDVTVKQIIDWSEADFKAIKFNCQPSEENQFPPGTILEAQWFTTDQKGKDLQLPTNTQTISEALLADHAAGLNVHLWCKLRARSATLAPSKYVVSNKRFLGIKMDPLHTTLQQGEEKEITAELMFPFICYGTKPNDECSMKLEIDIISNKKPHCTVPKVEAGKLPFCSAEIKGILRGTKPEDIKSQKATFTITTGGADEETITSAAVAYFSTQTVRKHRIWSKYTTPQIDVNFLPSSNLKLINSVCRSRNDPHTTSFDQCRFENQVSGEQIMYRNKVHGTQVNIFTARCNWRLYRTVYCNCGIGVIAGRSHWILDRCDSRPSKQVNELIDCGDNQLKIFRKGNDYTIELRTGTVVKVYTYKYSGGHFMNIDIHPSSRDIGVSEGLCGNLNKNKDDDLFNRDTQQTTNCPNTFSTMPKSVADFAISWRSKQNESLYTRRTPQDVEYQVCACARDKPGEEYISCRKSWRTICRPTGEDVTDKYTYRCIENKRKKKKKEAGGTGSDYARADRPPYVQPELPPYVEPTWTGNWTEEIAQQLCTQAIFGNPASSACEQLPNAAHEVSVEQCVQDIKLSGEDTWVRDAVENMKSVCLNEATRNLSLWTEPEPGKDPAPPVEILENLCPNDCSGNGQCIKGNCACNEGYGEADCSVNITAPPTLDGTTGDCDFSSRPCRATPVFGDPFINSPNLTCRVRTIELTSEGPVETGDAEIFPAEFLDSSQVMCPLPWKNSGRRKRSSTLMFGYGYAISVSNDGELFSEETALLSFDASCVECADVNQKCTIKENTCFIDQVCYSSTKSRQGEECYKCTPQNSATEWTWAEGCIIEDICYLPGRQHNLLDCLHCDAVTSNSSWTIKPNRCLIDNKCFNDGAPNKTDPCYLCNADRNGASWSLKDVCSGHNQGLYIAAGCSLAAVLLSSAGVILYVYKAKSFKKKHISKAEGETVERQLEKQHPTSDQE